MAICTLWGIGTLGDLWHLRWRLRWECLGWESLELECLWFCSHVGIADIKLELEQQQQWCFCCRRGGFQLVLDDEGLWKWLLHSEVLRMSAHVIFVPDSGDLTTLGVLERRRLNWSTVLSLATGSCFISRGDACPRKRGDLLPLLERGVCRWLYRNFVTVCSVPLHWRSDGSGKAGWFSAGFFHDLLLRLSAGTSYGINEQSWQLPERPRGRVIAVSVPACSPRGGQSLIQSFAHALDYFCMRWHTLNLPTLGYR